MYFNKKAMQTHILIILLISAVMTILILSVLSPFFKNDPQDCKLIEFEVKNKCKDGRGISFVIDNLGNKKLLFKINGETSDKYLIPSHEDRKISYIWQEGNIEILPYFEDIQGNQYECNGKLTTIVPERLIKC
jgi:hypothetical protein